MSTPGLAAALPDGVPWSTCCLRPTPLLKLADDAKAQPPRIIEDAGPRSIGSRSLRVCARSRRCVRGLFVSAPEPRPGLLALLDQPTFRPDAPAWVPASVLSFDQLSFDLGKAYKLISEVLIGEGGDQVNMLSVSSSSRLPPSRKTTSIHCCRRSAQNHYFVTFPPAAPAAAPSEDDEEEDANVAAGNRLAIEGRRPLEAIDPIGRRVRRTLRRNGHAGRGAGVCRSAD